MKDFSLKTKLFILLLIYMPLHYYICEIFIPGSQLDNLMRDVFLIGLFGMVLINNIKLNDVGIIMLINSIVLVLFAGYSFIKTGNTELINVLRTYLVPSLCFFICSNLVLSKQELNYIHKIIVVELALIAVYGAIQAFVLGDDFLIAIGYPSNNDILAASSYYINGFYGKQRAVGTFVGPNICGLVLAIALCVLLFEKINITKKQFIMYLIMIVVGLLATFSRSAIFGVVLAAGFVYLVQGLLQKFNVKMTIGIIISAVIACIAGIVVDYMFLDSLFVRMFSTAVVGMITGSDASAEKHFEDLYEPIKIVMENPMGFGFGNNGPMAIEYNANANVVESSIYLMMYELGIFFGILYFVPYVMIIIKTICNRVYKYYVPITVSTLALIIYVFLPSVQTYEAIFYVSIFMGLYCNSYVKKIYLTENV